MNDLGTSKPAPPPMIVGAIAECLRQVDALGEVLYSIAGKLDIAPSPIQNPETEKLSENTITRRVQEIKGIQGKAAELTHLAECIRGQVEEI